jgi:hypothetical protein
MIIEKVDPSPNFDETDIFLLKVNIYAILLHINNPKPEPLCFVIL